MFVKNVALAAFISLLLPGIVGASVTIEVTEKGALITPDDGIIFIPISGENLTHEDQDLPNNIAILTDGTTLYFLELDETDACPIAETPYEEGLVHITGNNMTVFEIMEADGATGWAFKLREPLEILAFPTD